MDKCPGCGYPTFKSLAEVKRKTGKLPPPGALLLCIECKSVSMVDQEGQLVLLTEDEIAAVLEEKAVQEALNEILTDLGLRDQRAH